MDHLAAENSGHVSGTVKHSQYDCAVVERLEDDQAISVCANPYRIAQVWARCVVMRSVRNVLTVLPYLADERDSAPRIVERDVVADLLQVNFGLWCEVRAHSLRAVFEHFGVLALQTVRYLGGGFRFADDADQAVGIDLERQTPFRTGRAGEMTLPDDPLGDSPIFGNRSDYLRYDILCATLELRTAEPI